MSTPSARRGPRLTPALLRELLAEQGWRVVPGNNPGTWRADSPIMAWNKVTPEWARTSRAPGRELWPGETYTELRQVVWLEDGARLTAWVREAGAPWVAVTMARATQARLREYVVQYGRAEVERAMSEAAEAAARPEEDT